MTLTKQQGPSLTTPALPSIDLGFSSSRVTDGAHRFLQFRIISLMIHVWIFCVIALFLYFLFRYLLQYFPFKLFLVW